jgi:hypothetical protein
MEAPESVRPIHSYDTQLRRILCGLHVAEHRSTKHARAVTCPACVEILGTKAEVAAQGADAPGPDATGGGGHS